MEDSRKYLDPKILGKVSKLDLKARLIVEGFISGLHESPFHGFSVEFAQHREYVPGDDVRHIDWKVWARSNRYYIKQYVEETNLRAYLLVDSSESMAFQPSTISKMDYACYMAASLAYLMLQQQDSVGLVLFDEQVRKFIRDSSHPSHLKLIHNELENAVPSGDTQMEHIFHDLAERLSRRGLVVIGVDVHPLGVGHRQAQRRLVAHRADMMAHPLGHEDYVALPDFDERPVLAHLPRQLALENGPPLVEVRVPVSVVGHARAVGDEGRNVSIVVQQPGGPGRLAEVLEHGLPGAQQQVGRLGLVRGGLEDVAAVAFVVVIGAGLADS